mmetsp:Transcript_105863/g.309663  ORF Transcript_105863/g.309663 Transcript_105863/m.309663 type:complete len:88 (-) Transcript_105863:319-582(-)
MCSNTSALPGGRKAVCNIPRPSERHDLERRQALEWRRPVGRRRWPRLGGQWPARAGCEWGVLQIIVDPHEAVLMHWQDWLGADRLVA